MVRNCVRYVNFTHFNACDYFGQGSQTSAICALLKLTQGSLTSSRFDLRKADVIEPSLEDEFSAETAPSYYCGDGQINWKSCSFKVEIDQ